MLNKENEKKELLQTFCFDLQVPAARAKLIGEEIKEAIVEAEIISGVKSGKTIEKRKTTIRTLPPETTYFFVSVGTAFVIKFIEKYAEKIGIELATDTTTVIRESEKYFIIWLKKKIGL